MSSVKAKDTPAGAMAPKPDEAAAEPRKDEVAAAAPPKPFLSEGVRLELEQSGKAGDPVTGGVFEKDPDTGQITYTDRAGKVTEL